MMRGGVHALMFAGKKRSSDDDGGLMMLISTKPQCLMMARDSKVHSIAWFQVYVVASNNDCG